MPDKILTVKMLTASDFPRINVDNIAGTLIVSGSYQLKDSTGSNVGHLKIITKTLTVAQKNALVDFLVNNVGLVAAANIQEGM